MFFPPVAKTVVSFEHSDAVDFTFRLITIPFACSFLKVTHLFLCVLRLDGPV